MDQKISNQTQSSKLRLLNICIIVFAAIEPIGELLQNYYLKLMKPIPIILMILYIHEANKSTNQRVSSLVQNGLAFSLVGDISLMIKGMKYFLIGAIFFMIGHLHYITAFRIGKNVRELKPLFTFIRKVAYVIIFSGLLLRYYIFWDVFPSKIIIIPYLATLSAESMVSLERYQQTDNSSFYLVLIGVVVFAISDNILGILTFFTMESAFGTMVVMFTYYTAQYFIMHGAIYQSNFIINQGKQNQSLDIQI